MTYANTLANLLLAALFLSGSAIAQSPSAEALDRMSGRLTAASMCVECHETESKVEVFHRECSACHANAAEHAAASRPGRVDPGQPASQECLGCHSRDSDRMHYAFGDHDKAGLNCTDCHGNHAPKVDSKTIAQHRTQDSSALCAGCHQDVLAKFSQRSHHPVLEGGVSCIGCHEPHSSKKLSLADATEQCLGCHQRVRGPHVFEHAPAVEDCANCHDPHGAANRHLLTVAQPMLCLQCHSLPNNRHGLTGSNAVTPAALAQQVPGAALRSCTSCHSQVHGSSQDQHLRF